MRLRSSVILLSALLATASGFGQKPTVPRRLYFLQNARGEWCTYQAEAEWQAQAGQIDTAGTIVFKRIAVLEVRETQSDETGDWAVNDEYTFADNGQPRALSRTINVLPGDISVHQTFSIRNGAATKIRESVTRLSDPKKAASIADAWAPALAVLTTSAAFPFHDLLEGVGRPNMQYGCRNARR